MNKIGPTQSTMLGRASRIVPAIQSRLGLGFSRARVERVLSVGHEPLTTESASGCRARDVGAGGRFTIRQSLGGLFDVYTGYARRRLRALGLFPGSAGGG